jgi:hypothetical protein
MFNKIIKTQNNNSKTITILKIILLEIIVKTFKIFHKDLTKAIKFKLYLK